MKISSLLRKLALKDKPRKLTLNDLVNKFQQEDNLFLIILLALLVVTPISFIPGVTGLLGLSIMLIIAQIAMGRSKIWLPRKFKKIKISHDFNEKLLKIIPYVKFSEKYIKKRIVWFSSKFIKFLFICCIFILSMVLMIPIPYLDFITSFAIILISIGLIEKDGLLLIATVFFIIIYILILFYILDAGVALIYKGYNFIKAI